MLAPLAQEEVLEDIGRLISAVSTFVAKADASRMQKPLPPTAADIEAYCADQQRKVALLLEEAEKLKKADSSGTKVRWTDIDGNTATDAPWLK
jgi:hypothetical protein